jgi:hypothetical protein
MLPNVMDNERRAPQMASTTTQESQSTVREPDPGDLLFIEAIEDDSNLEMDWLWFATKVTSNSQRQYCLQRALHINPHSRLAKRGLAQLRRRPNQPLDLS